MWAVSPIPSPLFLSKPTQPLFRRLVVSLPRSAPPQKEDDYGVDIGGLGQTLLTAATNSDGNSNTSPTPIPKRQKQKQGDGKQLSGSDVLWALQRAAARKKKKNKKKRELSSAGSDKEDDVDYSNMQALCIKSEWAVKLIELEKNLQELSEIN